MVDARYPDAWLSDRRVVRLSAEAHRLFICAMAWSASNRTDGILERDDLVLIHGVDATASKELVTAGLWEPREHGWLIVDFERTQTSKAQLAGLDHKRHQDRERQARKRARDRGDADPSNTRESRDVTAVTSDVTSTVTHRQGKARQGQARSSERDWPEVAIPGGEQPAQRKCVHGIVNGHVEDPWGKPGQLGCPKCTLAASA